MSGISNRERVVRAAEEFRQAMLPPNGSLFSNESQAALQKLLAASARYASQVRKT